MVVKMYESYNTLDLYNKYIYKAYYIVDISTNVVVGFICFNETEEYEKKFHSCLFHIGFYLGRFTKNRKSKVISSFDNKQVEVYKNIHGFLGLICA